MNMIGSWEPGIYFCLLYLVKQTSSNKRFGTDRLFDDVCLTKSRLFNQKNEMPGILVDRGRKNCIEKLVCLTKITVCLTTFV